MKSTKHLIPLAVLLILAGCGGSEGSNPVATVSNQSVVSPLQLARVFVVPAFGADDAAILVAGYEPDEEQPDEEASLTVTATGAHGEEELAQQLGELFQEGQEREGCATAILEAFHEQQPREQAVSPLVRPRYQELAEGTARDFFILTTFRTAHTVRVLSPEETTHCTIFSEAVGGTPVLSREKAAEIARAFDSDNPLRPGSGIYDRVRSVYGSEWNVGGGRDGDDKIVLVFLTSGTIGSEGLFGFFSPTDEDREQSSTSNGGEILYLNADRSTTDLVGTMAHEFQHMINYNNKVIQQGAFPEGAHAENTSIDEGLAVLSEHLAGFSLETGNDFQFEVVSRYLRTPEKFSFFNFFEVSYDYGQSFLFFRYLLEQFGEGVIHDIASSSQTGMPNLDQHIPVGFAEAFHRWNVANYASTLEGPVPSIYRYPSGLKPGEVLSQGTLPELAVTTYSEEGSPSTRGLKAWSANYIKMIRGDGSDLNVSVDLSDPNTAVSFLHESPSGTFEQIENLNNQ